MKKAALFLSAVIVFTLVLSPVVSIASDVVNDGTAVHWAESSLNRALADGLIDSDGGSLHPDDSITAAQAITILCRALTAQVADRSAAADLSSKWYYEFAAKSFYLGLIDSSDAESLEAPMSRQDALRLLAEGLQLNAANPDYSVLDRFSDSDLIESDNRRALASLISHGIVTGSDGKLTPETDMTRASFISVIYNVIGNFVPSGYLSDTYGNGAMIQESASLSGNRFLGGVWFSCAASSIKLDNVAADTVTVRSHRLNSLDLSGGTKIDRLVLAAGAGDVEIASGSDAAVGTLAIGTGGGTVTSENVNNIEITGDNRYVIIRGISDLVEVSGEKTTVLVASGARVRTLNLLADAAGSKVVADGAVTALDIKSAGTAVSGKGAVTTLTLHNDDTTTSTRIVKLVDEIDDGLTGAAITLSAPDTLPVGAPLNAEVILENGAAGSVCELSWYLDGELVSREPVKLGDPLPGFTHSFAYTRDMRQSADIKAVISYETKLNEYQELTAEKTVALENYSKKYWMNIDAPAVLNKVPLGYIGDYTLEWALANDLSDYEKEVWINANGYTSATDYLLWINLAYQRVNILKRSGDSWELIKTCIVGTGRSGRGTPPGVWTTSYKQTDGWTTGSYTVKPVVRFMGSVGYAFHSRLYYPGSSALQDPSIGFPVSIGCVRMFDEDVWFIHDTIPDGTTVVVY